jgi:RHS repeat-associated protein
MCINWDCCRCICWWSDNINSQNGLVNSVTDPLGHTVTNTYNTDYSLNSVSTTVGGQTVANSYTYDNDRLKTITHNGFAYTFVYDTFGNVTEVKVGTTTLITNAYQARTGRLNSFTYGNGDTVEYVFDSFDRITGVKIGGVLTTTYDYDANGVVGRVTDVLSGKSTRYVYDFANRLVRVEDSNGNSVAFGYDANNNASTFIDTVNGTTYTTAYTYDSDNRPELVTSPSNSTTGYGYDVLGRLTSKTWTSGSTAYATTYTYKNHPTDTSLTSTQLASIQNGSNPSIAYLYDANGNITSITEGTNTIQYIYNELNEVIRENNQRDNKTFVYNYDLGGNLLSKVEYAYTTGTLGTPVDTIPYVYGNTNWKDLLTSFDGKAITYDAIGNPLTYDGGTFAWEGRKLTSFNKTGLAVSYTYNENGIRTSKTVNGITTNYRLSGDKVTFEQTGSDTIYYVYDTQGQLISMILNGTEYAYVRNAQNDIIGLINSVGTQVVFYTYSTWGEVLSMTGSLASTLGAKNPYRYRGYRYDSETGLYYLQSRYYNPQWGRYINADDTSILGIEQGSLIQYNLFTYSLNNPVNMIDEGGYCAANIIGGIIGGVSGAILGVLIADAMGLKGWKRYALIAGATIAGAALGAFLGPYISRMSSAIASKIAAKAATGTVVIGETMQRVTQYASKINALTYNGLYNYSSIASKFGSKVANFLGKVDNATWLLDKMVKGYKIVDIGIDLNRAARSSSYLMEQILTFFYQNKEIVNRIIK